MDINSLKKMNISDIDKKVLCGIENVISKSNDWDVVKEEQTRFIRNHEVTTENVKVKIKEKTIELGATRNDEELAIEIFTFNIGASVIKAYKMSYFKKHDPNALGIYDVKIHSKDKKTEIDMSLVRKKVKKAMREKWEFGVKLYMITHMTQKNKERFEKKMNLIQGPIFRSLTNGTWKPFKEQTEPNFSVTVEDLVAFGDFFDARNKTVSTVTPAPGSTIRFNINTVRRFSPGEYKLSMITVKDKGYKETTSWPFLIFHHELVSPRKIVANLLLTPDLNEGPYITNYLNRYDWCQGMHFGNMEAEDRNGSSEDEEEEEEDLHSRHHPDDEDSDQYERDFTKEKGSNEYQRYKNSKMGLIYFTPVTDSLSFEAGVRKGFQKESSTIYGAHQIYGPTVVKKDGTEQSKKRFKAANEILALDEHHKVSIGMNMDILDPNTEGWLYGTVFEDDETHLNFAFAVFHDVGSMKHFKLGAPESFKKETFSKMEKKFMLKMKDFIKSEFSSEEVEDVIKKPENVKGGGSDSDGSSGKERASRGAATKKKKGSDDDSDDESKPKKEKKARSGGGKANAFTTPIKLSEELADIVGGDEMPRHEVVKRMWAYIKENNLQDPKNKQFIICDEKLSKVIPTKKFKGFGITRFLKEHMNVD